MMLRRMLGDTQGSSPLTLIVSSKSNMHAHDESALQDEETLAAIVKATQAGNGCNCRLMQPSPDDAGLAVWFPEAEPDCS